MKTNNQRGYTIPVLISVIALLIVGCIYLYSQNTKATPNLNNVDFVSSSPTPISQTQSEPSPVISSILPSAGPVGSNITISGTNLNGFEGGTAVWIENRDGMKGVVSVNSYLPQGATTLKLNIPNKVCTKFTGESGLPCPSFMSITPGVYNISVRPWSVDSNKVKFTVTSQDSQIYTQAKIAVLSPKGGETWKIGSNQSIKWNTTGIIKPEYIIAISLVTSGSGYGYIKTLSATTSSFTLNVPSFICWGGDSCEKTKPGNYYVHVALYDSKPCLGLCPNASTAKLLGQDESDNFITITN